MRQRAAKRRPEARLEKWKSVRMVGLVLLVVGSSLVVLASVLPLTFFNFVLAGVGIPLLVVGAILTLVFSVKISELKRLNPSLASGQAQADAHRVAQRIPRAQVGLEREQLDKLKALFKVSERVKIDDIASMLGTSRKDVFDKLLLLSKSANFQISEDVVVIEKGQTDRLLSELDKQFGEWGTKEETKAGKI